MIFRDEITEKEIRVFLRAQMRQLPIQPPPAPPLLTGVTAIIPPSYYRIMTRPSKRKRSNRENVKEKKRQRKVRKIQEERGWESSEAEKDVTALGLLQRSASRLSASEGMARC